MQAQVYVAHCVQLGTEVGHSTHRKCLGKACSWRVLQETKNGENKELGKNNPIPLPEAYDLCTALNLPTVK